MDLEDLPRFRTRASPGCPDKGEAAQAGRKRHRASVCDRRIVKS